MTSLKSARKKGKDVPDELKNFKEIKQIGEGTYGVVYKAVDKRHNITYALKRIKIDQ
jgi:serine/threonine protein kinase